jgi:hypothetical protein
MEENWIVGDVRVVMDWTGELRKGGGCMEEGDEEWDHREGSQAQQR